MRKRIEIKNMYRRTFVRANVADDFVSMRRVNFLYPGPIRLCGNELQELIGEIIGLSEWSRIEILIGPKQKVPSWLSHSIDQRFALYDVSLSIKDKSPTSKVKVGRILRAARPREWPVYYSLYRFLKGVYESSRTPDADVVTFTMLVRGKKRFPQAVPRIEMVENPPYVPGEELL